LAFLKERDVRRRKSIIINSVFFIFNKKENENKTQHNPKRPQLLHKDHIKILEKQKKQPSSDSH